MLRGKFTAELTEAEGKALMRPVVGTGAFKRCCAGCKNRVIDKGAL